MQQHVQPNTRRADTRAVASQHIAIVDDHAEIRELVGRYLTQHGFRVSEAENGAELRRLLERDPPDLLVLDIMMPGEDGLSLCRSVHAEQTVPVIFLTAVADDTDRIIGLELGADDYLTKPFNPRELLARVRAVLRRASMPAAQGQAQIGRTARFDRWQLDLARRELVDANGVSMALSTAEFRLLKVFLEHPGTVLSRDQLMDLTVSRTADPFDRSIDNQVSRLRKKIEEDPKNPSIILTHWGGGYSLTAEVYSS
ncbi:MAG: response regulator [Mesorhizobium sp.]|nr:MAG: response regulator [Mesorhizobium sp.]